MIAPFVPAPVDAPLAGVSVAALLTSALAGALFGVALAAPPGPMNAVIAEESVLRGWRAGVRAGLGALSADVCFFVLALFGAVAVVRREPLLHGLLVGLGGVLMCYFAYDAFREARAASSFTPDEVRGRSRGFRKAFVLALTNPYQIVFWLTVGVGLLEAGTLDVFEPVPYVGSTLAGALVVETGSPALLVGFFAGILCWVLAYPASLVAAGRRIDAFAPLVAYASALVLGGFGVVFLVDAAGTLG